MCRRASASATLALLFLLSFLVPRSLAGGETDENAPLPDDHPIPIEMRDVPPEEDPVTPERGPIVHDLRTGRTVRLPMVERPLDGLPEFVEGKQGEAPLYTPPKNAPQLNFGLYEITPDPTAYPYSAHVRLSGMFVSTGGDTISYMGSGTLIDPLHVVTAGHCVYTDESGDKEVNDWAVWLLVGPGYTNGKYPFGGANAVSFMSWPGWVDDDDYDHDMALITLDRPIGALTGWRGYAWSDDCGKFTSGTWYHHAYPAEGYDYNSHRMRTNVGKFDGCDKLWGGWYGNEVWAERPGYGGTSGAGAMRDGKVYAVRSNSAWAGIGDRDAFDTRINRAKYLDIRDEILAATPDVPTLHALDYDQPDLSLAAGAYLQPSDFLLHNFSKADFNGSVEVQLYLSDDVHITPEDVLLGTITTSRWLESLESVRVSLPGWQIPGTTPSGQYFLGVRIRGSTGDTDWRVTGIQDTDVLWIECEALQEMEYLEPAYATSCLDTVVTLRWVHQNPVSRYYVRVGPDCDSYIHLGNTTGNSYTVDGLERGKTYYWRVQPVSDCGVEVPGPWGPCYSIHIAGEVPDTVQLVGPTDGQECLDHVEVMLDWEDLPQAEVYHVEFGSSCGSGSIDATSASEMSRTGLNRGETYYWRVRGRSGCGENGPWSGCRSFTTHGDPIPAVAKTSPADEAGCLSRNTTVLQWDPVAGAAEYEVRFGTVFNTYSYPDTGWAIPGTSLNPGILDENQTYYWTVAAVDSCGDYGTWTPSWSFDTEGPGPDPPAYLVPGDTLACSAADVVLQWSKVPGADQYQVEVGSCPGGTAYTTANTYYDLGSLPAATYGWRVRARNTCSSWGPWSACRSFTVEVQPPGVPLNLASSTHPQGGWSNLNRIALAWNTAMEDCGLAGYSVDHGIQDPPHDPPDTVVDTTGLGFLTDPLSDRSDGYYCFVRAIDEAGNASPAYATAGPFRIDTVPPLAQVERPEAGEGLVAQEDYPIRWIATDDRSGVAEIRLDYSTDGGATFAPVTTKPIDPTTVEFVWEVPEDYTLAGLVRVTVVDSAGNECADQSNGAFAIASQTGVGDPSRGRQLVLGANYPNPFADATRIKFELPADGEARLVVYDAVGRRVRGLALGWFAADRAHEAHWDGRGEDGRPLASGLYYYCLEYAGRRLTRRMLHVR